MAQDSVSMPGVFGGLMRYNEEYDSKIKFKPEYVIGFIVIVAIAAILLRAFFPITI
ncbi:MAG TPA: preprotein translocase subunit Sec61beta [Candidatus Nanoarchaeia archaeon]|nr:preprotein translocase subunit Sec61beta [Candidatus Nanoarchaeia archaeon]